MFKFIKKSPFGFILGAAAIVLVVSPEAREGARKAIVKGTTVVLNFVDQVKGSSLLSSQNSPELLSAPAEQVTDQVTESKVPSDENTND
ncbi:hypothetical protein [Desulfosporosinus sp. OT]|uniref:hypothetical protein n=1 Tax=Desulfosporosinus sp. OT TaxID=913865 RepID=UPI0002239E2B|nr:hypothetical protein [Desulfosporosinus sp. OT]EGW40076.1 hypothetical protein DOT_1791 [Desulfosporosinus sp. OT]